MTRRTFVIGDIHGDVDALRRLFARMPDLDGDDTVVFLGDYLDRGPSAREVVRVVRAIDEEMGCQSVALRGNHEDAWLRVIDEGWPEFLLPAQNGCLATLRSFTASRRALDAPPTAEEMQAMLRGGFFPDDVVAWLRALPWWHEDEHGIYVHAGLPRRDGRWLHPSEAEPRSALLWTRTSAFFTEYRGKRVVVGHTATSTLPQELSAYTPEDPTDLFAGECVLAIDTEAGRGGFLTCVELPELRVYSSR